MKLLIASDIHGSATWCSRLMDAIEREDPERVILLGDLLYHGPRNDLPEGYAPKQVIPMLNGIAENVIAVRGNCEAEVDQMVLDFPCMADYAVVMDPKEGPASTDAAAPGPSTTRELFCTHGHIFGPGLHNSVDNMPPLATGSILLYGHTHIKVNQDLDTSRGPVRVFNPGSVSIPKDGTHSYGIYEDGCLRAVELG
jgi:putative phosphoesterase